MTADQLVDNLKIWPEPEVCRYLAAEVRRLRLEGKESQQQFAERAGIPLRTYKRFESHGQAHLETFLRALKTLGRVHYLFMLFPARQQPQGKKSATEVAKRLAARAQAAGSTEV